MKLIDSFDTCLSYANRLGFAGKSNIANMQRNLCNVADTLLEASGNTTWYHKEFKPFRVVLHTYKSNGFCYPALGSFDIIKADGTKVKGVTF